MAVPYYTPTQPYKSPLQSGQTVQNQLYANQSARNSLASAAPPAGGAGAQIPYSEFAQQDASGNTSYASPNTSRPLYPGYAPPPSKPSSPSSSGGGGGGGGGYAY